MCSFFHNFIPICHHYTYNVLNAFGIRFLFKHSIVTSHFEYLLRIFVGVVNVSQRAAIIWFLFQISGLADKRRDQFSLTANLGAILRRFY